MPITHHKMNKQFTHILKQYEPPKKKKPFDHYYCATCGAKVMAGEFCKNDHGYIADWYGKGKYEGD